MLLDTGHSYSLAPKARSREPDGGEDLPRSFVEFGHIPRHIHVPHMVAL